MRFSKALLALSFPLAMIALSATLQGCMSDRGCGPYQQPAGNFSGPGSGSSNAPNFAPAPQGSGSKY